MTPEQFCYWLQGYAEITNSYQGPNPQQWQIINDHLKEVFKKVTPNYTMPSQTTQDLMKEVNEQWTKTTITC